MRTLLALILVSAGIGAQHPAVAAADAVREASPTELTALARQRDPDPWLVADELEHRGQREVARRFAQEVPGDEGRSLVRYLAARPRARADDLRPLWRTASEARGPARSAVLAQLDAALEKADGFEAARTQIARSVLHRRLRQRPAARAAALAAAERARSIGWLGGAAAALKAAAQASDDDVRLDRFRASLAIQRERGFRLGQADLRYSIGDTLATLGRYQEALREFAQVETLIASDPPSALAARTARWIALTHARRGRPDLALSGYERSLSLAQALGDRRLIARIRLSLSDCHSQLGNDRRALSMAQETLRELGPEERAAAQGTLGVALLRAGRPQDALPHLDAALKSFTRAKRRFPAAAAMSNVALAHMRTGNLSRAEELQQEALQVALELQAPWLIASCRFHLGQIQRRQGRFDAARASAMEVLRAGRRLASATLLVRGNLNLARLGLDEDRPREAVAAARAAITHVRPVIAGLAIGEDVLARQKRAEIFSVGLRAALRTGEVDDVSWMLESGRAGTLLDTLGGGVLRGAPVPPELVAQRDQAFENEERAVVKLRKLEPTATVEEIESARAAVDRARADTSDALAKIQRSTKTSDLVFQQPASLTELRTSLRDDEALVLFALLAENSAALVVTPDGARLARLGPAATIIEQCRAIETRISGVLRGRNPRGLSPKSKTTEAAAELKRLVFDPLALGDGVRRVLISPDGDLARVPFTLLAGDREVAYVASGTTYSLLRGQPARRGRDVLALGDPVYASRSGLAPLPNSRTEAEAIADHSLVGDRATRAALLEQLQRAQPWRAVHLACHGQLDDQPLESALMLTPGAADDGRLTVLQVFGLPIRADLVALSACDTARGQVYRAEGVFGFTHAFLSAGAPRVLVSLWKVDDAATRALMTRFYELWNPREGTGQAAATALRAAQEHVRQQPAWRDPAYWAAWQLWGLPD